MGNRKRLITLKALSEEVYSRFAEVALRGQRAEARADEHPLASPTGLHSVPLLRFSLSSCHSHSLALQIVGDNALIALHLLTDKLAVLL